MTKIHPSNKRGNPEPPGKSLQPHPDKGKRKDGRPWAVTLNSKTHRIASATVKVIPSHDPVVSVKEYYTAEADAKAVDKFAKHMIMHRGLSDVGVQHGQRVIDLSVSYLRSQREFQEVKRALKTTNSEIKKIKQALATIGAAWYGDDLPGLDTLST